MNKILFLSSILLIPVVVQSQITAMPGYAGELKLSVDKSKAHSLFNNPAYWVNIGVGGGTSGLAGILGVSYKVDEHLVSLRGSRSGEIIGSDFWDAGLLYGRSVGNTPYFASIAAGIGMIGGTRREGSIFSTDSAEDVPVTIGLPLEGQFLWRFSETFGIGIYSFASINAEESFAGAALSLQVGKL